MAAAKQQQENPREGILRDLIASLMGDKDVTFKMRVRVDPDRFPDTMRLEADMLRVIYSCAANEMPPTPENVVSGLLVERKRREKKDDLEKFVDKLFTRLEDQNRNPAFFSMWGHQYLKELAAQEAVKEAGSIIQSPVGTTDERLERALGVLSNVTDRSDSAMMMSGEQLGDMALRTLKQRDENRKAGIEPGPSLKFLAFTGRTGPNGIPEIEGKIPFLKWGDMTLITAREGRGKSTLVGVLAEHNAWDKGYDCLIFNFENTLEEMNDRSIARNCFVPVNYLENGPVQQNKKLLAAIQKWYQQITDPKRGEIIQVFCPGWDVFSVMNTITKYRQISAERGRGLVVFVDYYNKINWTTFGYDRPQALGMVAAHLKDHIQRENARSPVHGVVLAQESEDRTNNESYAYGSKEIVQYSQVHISIQRKVASEYKDLGEKRLNALGDRRVIHASGEWSGDTDLRIFKANKASTGTVKVLFEGRLFRINDLPNEAKSRSTL